MKAGAALSAFLKWWVAELAALGGAGRRGGATWRALAVRRGDEFDVYLRHGTAVSAIGRIGAGQPDTARVMAALTAAGAIGDGLVLRLPPDDVIATRLLLPAAVRDVLPNVIHNRLERIAPWPPEQALFAWREAIDPAAAGQVAVDVWVASRTRTQSLLAELDGLGLAPTIVDTADDATGESRFNLLGADASGSTDRQRRVARTLGVAAVSACAVGLVGLAYGLWASSARATIEAEIASLSARLAGTANTGRPDEGRRLTRLRDARGEAPSATLAMEALSQALPSDTYLERLELRDGVVTMAGKSRNVPALIPLLEADPQFSQVQFAAPTTRKDGELLDSFALSARVRGVGQQGGTPAVREMKP